MIYLRIRRRSPGVGQTLVAHPSPINSPGASQPILNTSFKGREGPRIEPDFHFVLGRVGRWSRDDVE
jgi:hypothetical protein